MGLYKDALIKNEDEGNVIPTFLSLNAKPCAIITIYNFNEKSKDIIIYENSEVNISFVKETKSKFKLVKKKCRIDKFEWILGLQGPLLKGIYIDISKDNKNKLEYIEIDDIRDLSYI